MRIHVVLPVAPQRQSPAIVPARTLRCFCWRYGFGRQNQGNSASTILSKISHISWNHQYKHGFSVGLLPGHKLAITGMRRYDRSSAKETPVTVQILRAVHRRLNFSVTHDRVLWGATVLGYFYLLRRSEYLANGRKSQPFAITREDVAVLDDSDKPCTTLAQATKVKIRFRGMKTDQFGEGTTRTLRRSGAGWCCPVQAAWFLTKHHQATGALANTLLYQVSRGEKLQVSHVASALKYAAASIGEDPAHFGSHSLRSGGATALFNAGIDSLAVKMFGRWKSDAVERYTVFKEDLTASLSRSMLGKHA